MGFYIEGPAKGKAQFLVDQHGGEIMTAKEARPLVPTRGVIVVLDNGPFEAANYSYDLKEFDRVIGFPGDNRPMTVVVIDRALADELSGRPS